jgi:hypothetical protein
LHFPKISVYFDLLPSHVEKPNRHVAFESGNNPFENETHPTMNIENGSKSIITPCAPAQNFSKRPDPSSFFYSSQQGYLFSIPSSMWQAGSHANDYFSRNPERDGTSVKDCGLSPHLY